MNTGDRPGKGEEDSIMDDLPEEWEQTERHPHLPGKHLAICQTEHGTILYDRDQPNLYLIGQAITLGDDK